MKYMNEYTTQTLCLHKTHTGYILEILHRSETQLYMCISAVHVHVRNIGHGFFIYYNYKIEHDYTENIACNENTKV